MVLAKGIVKEGRGGGIECSGTWIFRLETLIMVLHPSVPLLAKMEFPETLKPAQGLELTSIRGIDLGHCHKCKLPFRKAIQFSGIMFVALSSCYHKLHCRRYLQFWSVTGTFAEMGSVKSIIDLAIVFLSAGCWMLMVDVFSVCFYNAGDNGNPC